MKLLISFMLSGLIGLLCTLNAQNTPQLVIFIQDGKSVSQDFKRNTLSEIKKIANHNGLKLKMVDASKGAPQEVTFTPAIFYQNGKENILFNGRYNELDDLSGFVKSRGKDQPATIGNENNAPLTWNLGRATLKTTMHINPLSGTPPKAKQFDADQFESEAHSSIMNGMEYFRSASAGQALAIAKSYHMEFYPEVKEGVLLIQMELYSEFDSNEPVFKTVIPSGNEWKEWQVAFEKAGNRMEKALVAQISNWGNGDGFDTLRSSTPKRTWDEALSYQYKETPTTFTEKGLGVFASDKE